MRNYTADGKLKVTSEAGAAAAAGDRIGEILAAGRIASLAQDDDGIAASQALGVPADTDGLALAQALTEDEELVLEEGADALTPPRFVTLTSGEDLSGIKFTIVGLDESGAPISEELTGPDNETVTSQNAYSSITSITPDGSDSDTVEAGWPASDTPFPLALSLTTLSPARRVTLSSEDDLSALTFTIEGLDENGAPASEAIQGPNAGTVTSETRFSSIVSITPDDVSEDAVSAGWPATTDELFAPEANTEITQFYLRNTNATPQEIELYLVVDGEEIPWRPVYLQENEVCSLLHGEGALPLGVGQAIRALATTENAVAFTLHGIEGEAS